MQYKSRWDVEGGADPCKADGDLETRLTKHKVRSLLAQLFTLDFIHPYLTFRQMGIQKTYSDKHWSELPAHYYIKCPPRSK